MSVSSIFTTNYINHQNLSLIVDSNNEPKWLKERREIAFQAYLDLPFDKDTLFYKYTNFRKFSPENLLPAWSADEILLEIDDNADMLETQNHVVSKLATKSSENGVIFTTLKEMLIENESLAKTIITEADAVSKNFDKLGSLAKAFAKDIIILYIPKNKKIDEPIKKLLSLKSSNTASFHDFIIYADEGSESKLLEIFTNFGDKIEEDQLHVGNTTILLKPNSNLKYQQIQVFNSNVVTVSSRKAIVKTYSKLKSLSHVQGSQMTRHNSFMSLEENGSEGYDLFIKFGNNRQRFDIKSELNHIGQDTIGQTHARSVMMDRSESILRGLITINESAINADSWLTSKGMTTDKAKISAIPSLAILQNDVKAAHAASVEPLNEDTIFYLETRGIDKEEAREMLVKGYFEYVLKMIEVEEFAEISRKSLHEKWDLTK